MKRVLCFLGRHDWQRHVNHEASGPDANYDLCSRCGKEKKQFGPPTQYSRVIPGG